MHVDRTTASHLARCLGIGTLAVASVCATLPTPAALAAPAPVLLAQDYQPPPAYPPTEPPPSGYAPPPPSAEYAPPPQSPPMDGRDAAAGAADGAADAPREISGTLWFFAGFFLSWVGILLGYLIEPSPDGVRLVGKSPAYVAAYGTSYKAAGKSYQGIHAVYGCVTAGVLWIVFTIVLVFATLSVAAPGA